MFQQNHSLNQNLNPVMFSPYREMGLIFETYLQGWDLNVQHLVTAPYAPKITTTPAIQTKLGTLVIKCLSMLYHLQSKIEGEFTWYTHKENKNKLLHTTEALTRDVFSHAHQAVHNLVGEIELLKYRMEIRDIEDLYKKAHNGFTTPDEALKSMSEVFTESKQLTQHALIVKPLMKLIMESLFEDTTDEELNFKEELCSFNRELLLLKPDEDFFGKVREISFRCFNGYEQMDLLKPFNLNIHNPSLLYLSSFFAFYEYTLQQIEKTKHLKTLLSRDVSVENVRKIRDLVYENAKQKELLWQRLPDIGKPINYSNPY